MTSPIMAKGSVCRISRFPNFDAPFNEACQTGFASLRIIFASSSICTQSANASCAFSISIELAFDQSVSFILISPSSVTGNLRL